MTSTGCTASGGRAEPEQIEAVRQLHAEGKSLRGIAEDLSLGLQTVHTILGKDVYLDRGSRKILQRIAPDHLREKLYQRRKTGRKALQRQINTWLKTRTELDREARKR